MNTTDNVNTDRTNPFSTMGAYVASIINRTGVTANDTNRDLFFTALARGLAQSSLNAIVEHLGTSTLSDAISTVDSPRLERVLKNLAREWEPEEWARMNSEFKDWLIEHDEAEVDDARDSPATEANEQTTHDVEACLDRANELTSGIEQLAQELGELRDRLRDE